MSAPASRAFSIQPMISCEFPARSPTVGLTCASAILTFQLSPPALFTIWMRGLLRTSTRAVARASDLAVRGARSRSRAHRGWRGRRAAPLPRRGPADRGARVLLQAERRFLGAVRTRRLAGADR